MSWRKLTNPAGHEVWFNSDQVERVRHTTDADNVAHAKTMIMTVSGHETPVQEYPGDVVAEFSR